MAEDSTDAPPSQALRRKRRVQLALAAGLAGLVGLALYALWLEPGWVELTRHDVSGPKAPLTVLHVTDVHMNQIGSREEWVLEQAAALRPDLIVITGDTVNSPLGPGEAEAVTSFLKRLVATAPRLGVLACAGNHEDWAGPGSLACYRAAGVPVLGSGAGSRVLLGGEVVVHGVASAQAELPEPTAGFDILLCHYPVVLPRAAAAGFELVLAGHTHGGQVRLPVLGPPWLPFDSGEYVAGWFRDGQTRMYVARGIGMSILPVRFGARPELALHRIGRQGP